VHVRVQVTRTVTCRALLVSPAELMVAASPPTKKKAGSSTKREKRAILSSWAESFQGAMRTLESSAADSTEAAHAGAYKAKRELNAVLRAARNPGAPSHALSLTMRGLGYVFATTGLLPQAEAAYLRALTEARARGEASEAALGAWRDVAVICLEQRKYADAEAHHTAALAALQARAATAGSGGGKRLRNNAHSSEVLELQLCLADALRLQARLDEAEALVQKVLAAREGSLGACHPETLGAVYDLSHVLRSKVVASTGRREGEGLCQVEMERQALDSLDAAAEATASLDARWQGGLRALCEGSLSWGEQLLSLGSTAQAHAEHAEAVLLLRLALPVYEEAFTASSIDFAEVGRIQAHRPASTLL